LFGTFAAAQTKVAVISLQKAVLESAEIKAASAAMEARYKPRVSQIETLDREIAQISQNLQVNQGKLTPQAEADLSQQLQRKQRDVQRYRDDLQGDVDNERNTILQKASQRMQEVVKALAEEKGIDVVVDMPYTVYFKSALEITNDAIAAYNRKYPAPAGSPADTTPCRGYEFDTFLGDWGPNSGHNDLSNVRIARSRSCGSGVLLTIQFGANQQEKLWVERRDRSISFPPVQACPAGM
jgi:outer membrane protein